MERISNPPATSPKIIAALNKRAVPFRKTFIPFSSLIIRITQCAVRGQCKSAERRFAFPPIYIIILIESIASGNRLVYKKSKKTQKTGEKCRANTISWTPIRPVYPFFPHE